MTAVGDGRLDEDPAVSVGAVGVGGGDMESGALLQTVRNKPKTRGGQRIRTRSPCREKRVHASELPMTNSYLAEGWPVFRTLASLFGADPAPSGRDVKKVGGQRR